MKHLRSLLFIMMGLIVTVTASAQFYDLEAKPASLDEYVGKGKWTIVMFWASNCHVCNTEAEQYIQFHEKHKESNAQVVGVSLDGPAKKGLEKARGFVSRHDVTFPNLVASPMDIKQFYTGLTNRPWQGTPTFLIYTPEGELVAAQPGAVPADLIEAFITEQSASSK